MTSVLSLGGNLHGFSLGIEIGLFFVRGSELTWFVMWGWMMTACFLCEGR